MRFMRLVMCMFLVLVLAIPGIVSAQNQNEDQPFETDLTKVALAQPRSHGSLTIYPIVSSDSKESFNFLSLDKAMKGRKLSVKEWGSGSVPKLKVKNNAGKKTFIMAGEIVTGAKQDRMSAHDVLLKEKSKVTGLPVYCVEQGRWVMNSRSFASGQTAGTKTLRKSAVQKKSQGKIWSDVREKSAKSGTNSSTGTMQAVYSNGKIKRQIKAYQRAFVDIPRKNPDMVGFVAVVGGEVSSVDLFGDKKILDGVWKKLLKAIAVDAVTESTENKPELSGDDIRAFLEKGFNGSYKKIDNPGLGKEFLIEGENGIAGSTLVYKNKIVHMALFSADEEEKPRELRSNTPKLRIQSSNNVSSRNIQSRGNKPQRSSNKINPQQVNQEAVVEDAAQEAVENDDAPQQRTQRKKSRSSK